MKRHKCPVCKQMAETYRGNNVSNLGIRFASHNSIDGNAPILQDAASYCNGSFRLVYIVTLVP